MEALKHRLEQRSQGEVKFLTGGSCQQWQEPASAFLASSLEGSADLV